MDDDIEQLIQKFLDGELTRRERRQLLELMVDDQALRERLLSDETMLDAAARLPRPTPGADFVARVTARLPPQDPIEADHVVRTRPAVLRGFAAAAAVLLIGVGFIAGRNTAPASPGSSASATAAPPAVVIQLMLMQPDAQSVVVVGDFNGWDPVRSPLQKRENGLWGTTLTLTPGRYHYQFLIDGTKWLADPLAGETSADGFGAANSVLDVEA